MRPKQARRGGFVSGPVRLGAPLPPRRPCRAKQKAPASIRAPGPSV